MNAPGRRWRSPKEISAYLGVELPCIYRWCYGKKLPCARIGRLWFIDSKILEERLEREAAKTKP